jgi:hypothetical protein
VRSRCRQGEGTRHALEGVGASRLEQLAEDGRVRRGIVQRVLAQRELPAVIEDAVEASGASVVSAAALRARMPSQTPGAGDQCAPYALRWESRAAIASSSACAASPTTP